LEESPLGYGILVLVALLVGIGVAVATLANQWKRSQSLARWAASRGLQIHLSPDHCFGNRYPHFACLNHSGRRSASNVMDGRIGDHWICAFDYHYESGSDEDKRCHFSAVIVTTNLPLKSLSIRHTSVFDRMAAAVGFEGIQFEWAAFNKEFRVTSPDPRWAFDVLPQAALEFLMNSPRFILDFELCQIMAHRQSLFQPADFDAAIQLIEGILHRLPPSLVQELRGVDG
jgi:hypothetical protein